MITTNVYVRVFRIRVGDGEGTAFAIDVDGRQYLVSAKHVVSGVSGHAVIGIFHERSWNDLNVTLVGHAPGEIDVSVLASPDVQLSPAYALPPKSNGLVFAQDVYFLGFPYGLHTDTGETNRHFPLAFVKRALVSGNTGPQSGARIWYLDGINNPGFSGGPVVWKEVGKQEWNVLGVISGFRYTREPVFAGDQPTPLEYQYNTGIIVAYGIEHALDLISANAIGRTLDE